MIEGEKVNIRRLMPDDLEHILQFRNENKQDNEGKSIEDIQEWYDGIQEDTTKGWFIVTTKAGRPIGEIGYTQRDARRTDINIIRLGREHRNMGYGTDAMKAFSAFLFANTRVSDIFVFVGNENKGAIRCYEKCGFKRKAVRRAIGSGNETVIMTLENPGILTEISKAE